jgi:hypothetical protein
MTALAYKPNALEITSRLRDLYERRAGDRIFARMNVPNETLARFRREHVSGPCDFPDLEERIAFWDRLLAEGAAVEDDAIPSAYLTEMDQGLYGGLVDGEVRFQCDADSGWISSMVVPLWKDWTRFDSLRFDPEHPWFERYTRQLDLFVERANGKFGVSHFILIDTLNFAFELVGATETYMSLETHPEVIRRVIDFAFTLNAAVQDHFFDRAVLFDGGTSSNKASWLPGRVISESIDPYHMMSVAYFERWGREPVERILNRYDGGVLHIHGNGRHLLESAAAIPGVKVIEMGDDKGFPASFDIVDALRARAGDMPLSVIADFGPFVEKLDRHELPGGILYEVQNVPDAASANRCMEKVRAYRV